MSLENKPRKIIVIKPSSLGDIVHSLPFLDTMHQAFPDAVIDWVIAKGFEGLLDKHPMVRRLWVIHKDQWTRLDKAGDTLRELSRLFGGMKAEGYDLAVDLQGLLRSGVITYATGARIKVGFREAREGSPLFYTHRVEGGKDIHAVDRYLKIAAFLGCPVDRVRFPLPPPGESDAVRGLITRLSPYAVLVPGARWEKKRWPPDRFAELASAFDMKSVIVGSRSDRELAEKIAAASNGKAVSMAGKTVLGDLIALIRNARVVLTNDSGPMHIAAACGAPVVALFGPTNPLRTGPYGTGNIVLTPGIPCAPCYRKKCDDYKCMRAISVAQVSDALQRLLSLPQDKTHPHPQ